MPKAKVNYAVAATLVASGMTMDRVADKVGSANGESLRRGLARKGVTARSARTADIDLIVPRSVTAKVASDAVAHLKDTFNSLLTAHVGKLAQVKPSSNLKKLKKIGEVIEPFARTFKTINGEPGKGSLVNVQVLGSVRLDEIPDTIGHGSDTNRTPDRDTAIDLPQTPDLTKPETE